MREDVHSSVNFRPCGDCTACCSGQLAGEIYGHKMFPGKPCHFLMENKCSIYESRPTSPCKTFQCAWSQRLLDEDMRPDKIGLMVSVETKGKEQFLRIVEVVPKPPQESYQRIFRAAKKLGSRVTINYYSENSFL